MAALTAQDVIRMLDLKPHPEGGYFRETFRDTRNVGERPASTAAYFLLPHGERSHWHAWMPRRSGIGMPVRRRSSKSPWRRAASSA